jgi:PHD/YefM family antitoxin component YafN of YafNO toxin-antitoxin module
VLDTRLIHSLTDFLRNHKTHLTRLKETRKPEVLTINGKAELVIQDAESYQEMLDRLERAETLAALREGLASADRGELRDADGVFSDMKAR